jgi:chromosome segregation ATPase
MHLSVYRRYRFPLFLDPDKGGGSGGGTIESRLADAQAKLTERETQITSLTQERDSARTDLSTAKASVTSLTTERDAARNELATAKATVTSLTVERDTARSERDSKGVELQTASTNVTRLESLCNVHGIDPKDAPKVPPTKPGGETANVDALRATLKNCTDPKEKVILSRKIRELTSPAPAAAKK